MMSFNLDDYFIFIRTIKLNSSHFSLEEFLKLTDQIQDNHPESVIQFFNDRFVLNQEHIYNACYFMLKAFDLNRNISLNKNLELLLYLACSRQIKYSLKFFGLNDEILKKGELNYCVISKSRDIDDIHKSMNSLLNHISIDSNIFMKSLNKFNNVKNFFEISESQLIVILNSYDLSIDLCEITNENLKILYTALSELICEKMALLSLEKVKSSQ